MSTADRFCADKIHQEGAEYIKDTLEQRHETQGTSLGTDAAAAAPRKDTSIPPAKPPASNPGADDPTAGIPKGSGGLSSTAAVDSPVQSKRNSIFGTLRGFFGIEKKEKEAADADPKNAGTAAGAAATASGAALVAGHTMEIPDRTKVPSDNTETTGAGLGNKETETSAAAAAGTAKDATNSKMSDNTETTSKPAEGTGNTEKANEDRAEPSSDKKPAPAGGKPMENRDAIPVAAARSSATSTGERARLSQTTRKPLATSLVSPAQKVSLRVSEHGRRSSQIHISQHSY